MELHKVSPAFRHSDDIETIQRLQVKNRVLVKEISALKKHIKNIITEKDNCAIEWGKCRERERVLVEALEAIRDGEVWRNKIYPSDIARSALAAKEE